MVPSPNGVKGISTDASPFVPDATRSIPAASSANAPAGTRHNADTAASAVYNLAMP